MNDYKQHAQVAIRFLERCNLTAAEIPAFQQVQAFLAGIAQGRLEVVDRQVKTVIEAPANKAGNGKEADEPLPPA